MCALHCKLLWRWGSTLICLSCPRSVWPLGESLLLSKLENKSERLSYLPSVSPCWNIHGASLVRNGTVLTHHLNWRVINLRSFQRVPVQKYERTMQWNGSGMVISYPLSFTIILAKGSNYLATWSLDLSEYCCGFCSQVSGPISFMIGWLACVA